jgi:3-ketosteroid 9alpha-monooxygenase subunit A
VLMERPTGASAASHTGWMLLAFTGELEHEVMPATVGDRPMMVLRDGDRIRVADATCPHRGAHLGYGGVLSGEVVKCPFHGRLIAVGDAAGGRHRVREYRTVVVGGAVFVLLDARHEYGFEGVVTALGRTHEVVPGFVMPARVSPEYVIENVFDAEHFESIHKVSGAPDLRLQRGAHGELAIEGTLRTRLPNAWQDGAVDAGGVATRFYARVFSSTLVLTELGAASNPYVVVTGATPTPGGCVIRVAAAVPAGDGGTPPAPDLVRALLTDSRTAFEQDLVVWEHLVPGAPQNLDERDDAVRQFREFCRQFEAGTPA